MTGARSGSLRLRACIVGVVWTLLAGTAWGHGLDATALSLREVQPGVFDVHWRESVLRLPGANVQPMLPARCRRIGSGTATNEGDRVTLSWTIDCGPDGLGGSIVGVDDLGAAKINALLTIERQNGDKLQSILSPRNPSLIVPVQPSGARIVDRYLTLGAARLFRGPEHLLLVVGLVLLVSASGRLLRTITAFALGSSLTLAAAALHVAPVQAGAADTLIALTVLVLAVELARDPTRPTFMRRFPSALAALFGALHGLGFAGDFAALGAPSGDLPLALISFNGGIELGELIVVAALLTITALLWRRVPALARPSTRLAVYAMGILSAFWCFERAAVWLG